jgi:CheY-like chemotaxis protein
MNPIATKRLLLCDDSNRLRSVLADFLREEGYAVTEAASGEDALAFLVAEPCGTFDAVVMDYCLDPGLTGGETVNRMRSKCPEQIVVFVTGYELPHDILIHEAVLQKPVTPEKIIETVERLIRAKADTLRPLAP